jgi:hypothetical protein
MLFILIDAFNSSVSPIVAAVTSLRGPVQFHQANLPEEYGARARLPRFALAMCD